MSHRPPRSPFGLVSRCSLVAAALSIASCSSGSESLDPGVEAADDDQLGSVGLDLEIGDVTVNSLAYAITGNGFSKTGTLNVSRSRTLSAVIGGIPAGLGYVLTLSGTDAADPRIVCSATATFNVTARGITTAIVKLLCQLPRGNGSVRVEGTANVCPRIDAISVEPSEVVVGESMALTAEITDDEQPAPATFAWSASGGGIVDPASASAAFSCTEVGTYEVSLVVSDGDCEDVVTTTVTCSPGDGPAPPPNVRVNEVESSGGSPGDWIELFNAGPMLVDLSGFILRDNDDTHTTVLPAGTTIAPGAFLAVEESQLGYGLGGADSARLFDPSGALVDSHSWTAHATTTYGRCPDGTGAFATSVASTKGLANTCAPVGPTAMPWPGTNDVRTVDGVSVFQGNLSGLTFEPATASAPAALWAVRNGPGTLYRLVYDGAIWTPDPANGWGAGKAVRYTDGTGNPDSEGVTFAESPAFMYVATERNNDASTVSRLSILRFDTSAVGASLTATHDWNITADLPALGANLGLEAITWIPDSFLVSKGFFDETLGHVYNPAEYSDHGAGLFFVGIEGNGLVHAYALNHATGAFARIATFSSGNPGVMALEFDREVGYLWASCDDTCGNESGIFDVDATGRFFRRQRIAAPSTLPNINNEGTAFGPEASCVGGQKPFFWADDSETGGHSIRMDSIACGAFLP